MQNYEWPMEFRRVFDRGVESYRAGNHKAATLFNDNDKAFLASIGCTSQELFDFVEDLVRGGEPAFETTLLITAARRDYFLVIQKGKLSTHVADMSQLPS